MRLKSFVLVAAFCLIFSCAKAPQASFNSENGKLKVLATTAMIDDLIAEIAGDAIDHVSLILGDLDPHSYEIVKGDDDKILRADVIFSNGLGLEHGASVREHLRKHPCVVSLGDFLIQEDRHPFLTIDGQLDPHFWMDVELFSRTIRPIITTLSEKDPIHASLFEKRGANLHKKMIEKDRIFWEKMQHIPEEKRYLVSSHDAFYYFAKKYLASPGETDWKKRFMAPQGLAPDGQMSVVDIQKVSDFLCLNEISVVFPETNISQDALKKIVSICREKGLFVKIAKTPLYGDTMGVKGTGADTYLDMIEHNVDVLVEELSKKS